MKSDWKHDLEEQKKNRRSDICSLLLREATANKDILKVYEILKELAELMEVTDTPPLHMACRIEIPDIVALLLTDPAIDINAWDSKEETPLYITTTFSKNKEGLHIMEHLLKHPAIDPNALSEKKNTAIGIACSNGNLEQIKLLLAHEKTDINIIHPEMGTPIMLAIAYGHTAIMDLLLKDPRLNLNLSTPDGLTPMLRLLFEDKIGKKRKLHYIQQMVERGANPYLRATEKYGFMTPLSCALQLQLPKISDYLFSLHPEIK